MNTFRVFVLLAVLAVLSVACSGATAPAGTILQVRLTTEASSNAASGTPVQAVVIAPVLADGRFVVPARAIVSGVTADAAPAKDANDNQPASEAMLRLVFNQIRPSATTPPEPLACVLAGVDNARETVDRSGLIVGIKASETMEARLDQGISKLSARSSQFGQLLSSVENALVKKVDPSIDYKPGVELTLKLTGPLEWNQPVPVQAPPPIQPTSQLFELVRVEPNRTVAANPPKPSDLTNLLFIGTLEQIQNAFAAAGWFQSARRGAVSDLETARAMIEDRGYGEAPMSVLLLDGRPPDLTFEKQNDTFAKRHHIRIWQRPETFGGQPVFVGAATHDISITFSSTSRSFTHGIDPDIDKERAKVVNDLLFTGLVQGLSLVDRTSLPPDPTNATGDHLITDGKIAVLKF